MKKRYTVLAATCLGLVGFQTFGADIIPQTNYGVKYLSQVTTRVKADDLLNQAVKPDNSKVQAILAGNTSAADVNTDNMSKQEKINFTAAVNQAAENADLPTEEDKEAFKQAIIDYFTPGTEVYQNVTATTDQVIDEINENHKSPLDKITGEKVMASAHGAISDKVAGGVLNVAISAVCGNIAGAGARVLVKKYGLSAAEQILSRTLRNQLIKMGVKNAKDITKISLKLLKCVADPGYEVAKWIDSMDKIKNNGWWELW